MSFPDISVYPDFQQEAIKVAKDTKYASFCLWGITYGVSKDRHGFRIEARKDSEQAWFIYTDWRSDHYVFKVNNNFRGRGVGKTLFTTKQALDGILQQEWSWIYSRMFFLIKFGYMPLYRISQVHKMSGDRPLTQEESRVLLDDLNFYVKNKDKLPDWFGTCPFLIRMLYAPRGAQALLERIKTIS